VGLFVQDSWRLKKNLTLNYGLRWDRIVPWYEKYNQIATFAPGRLLQSESQSSKRGVVFQCRTFQRECTGNSGQRLTALFPWPRNGELRYRASQNLRLAESKSLQFRIEAFNVFNHAQFFGPQAVDGNISSSTFGQVVSAAAPRLLQASAKFIF
jgi:hypothetical protein